MLSNERVRSYTGFWTRIGYAVKLNLAPPRITRFRLERFYFFFRLFIKGMVEDSDNVLGSRFSLR